MHAPGADGLRRPKESSTSSKQVMTEEQKLAGAMTDPQALLDVRLSDLVPFPIAVIDRSYHIVRANQHFEEVFGEWQGRRCFEVYKGRSEPCRQCSATQTFADGQVRARDETVRDRHGQQMYHLVHVVPIRTDDGEIPYVMEISTDVSEARRLQHENRILFDGVPCYISVLDRNLSIVHANSRFRETFGEPSGRHCYEVYKAQPHECDDCPARKTFQDGQVHTAPQEGVDKAGKRVDYVVTTSPFSDNGGEPTQVIEMALDVTELRALERQLLESERLAAVGETVAGIAHGVKNILMGLEGGVYVVGSGLRRRDQDVIDQGWEMLERNIQKISSFIRDFLAFSKGRDAEIEIASANDIAREVVDLYQHAAKEAGIELAAELAPDDPQATLDTAGIHTCLTNLVSNAIDACQTSEEAKRHVTVKTFEENGDLIFEVLDDGCGMDYEVKQKVFTTFFTTKGTSGTGLGLLETRKIVSEHGGRISVESTPGEGSVFRLVFPRHRLPSPGKREAEDVPTLDDERSS